MQGEPDTKETKLHHWLSNASDHLSETNHLQKVLFMRGHRANCRGGRMEDGTRWDGGGAFPSFSVRRTKMNLISWHHRVSESTAAIAITITICSGIPPFPMAAFSGMCESSYLWRCDGTLTYLPSPLWPKEHNKTQGPFVRREEKPNRWNAWTDEELLKTSESLDCDTLLFMNHNDVVEGWWRKGRCRFS